MLFRSYASIAIKTVTAILGVRDKGIFVAILAAITIAAIVTATKTAALVIAEGTVITIGAVTTAVGTIIRIMPII